MKTSPIKRIWSIFSTMVTIILLILQFLLVGVRLLGYTPYAIISGSMEPVYPVGSVVYVKKAEIEDIIEDTPITYVLNEDLVVVTHRVVEVDKEQELFTTKGDSNNTNDAKPVHYNNVLGIVEYSLPYLGYVSVYIKSRKGIILIISVFILMTIGSLIKILLDDKEKERLKRI